MPKLNNWFISQNDSEFILGEKRQNNPHRGLPNGFGGNLPYENFENIFYENMKGLGREDVKHRNLTQSTFKGSGEDLNLLQFGRRDNTSGRANGYFIDGHFFNYFKWR